MTAVDTAPTGEYMGSRLLRREDAPLLTGEAKFTDDLTIPGALHLAVLRSPYAHATINSVDLTTARSMPGVVAAYSGADLADEWESPMPCAWTVTEDMKNPPHHPLATTTANYVGDGVAAVLARTEAQARDAVEAIVVDYTPLPAIADLEAALRDDALVHEDLGTNRSYTWELVIGAEAIDEAFANAAYTVDERFVQQRLIPMAMEPRACAAVPEPFGGGMTLYSSTQIPHILKVMTALTLGLPEQHIRVVAPSVGGGFGSKLEIYAEDLLCVALARKHRAPVRWVEERTEGAQATIHGRGQLQHVELAADADGRITAIRTEVVADMGAYLQLVTPGIPLLGAFLYSGVYDLPETYSFKCTGVFTTTTPTDAYRGAGRPEATYAVERAIDRLAQESGIDPAELRRRNFIKREQFPYTAATGLVYDSGDYEGALDKALELVGYDDLRAEQARRRDGGAVRQLGIGISSYYEMCGLAPSRVLSSLNYAAGGWESATVRVLPTSKVQVISGCAPHGQGHETSWAMIVADRLGVAPEDIEVLHSDTAISPLGMDTYGSRSLAVGGVAIYQATDKVIDKARAIAAHLMEAAEEDLEFESGTFKVRGSPGSETPLADVAFAAFTAHNLPDGMEPNLEGHATYDPPNFSWPFGTHICVVEVDEETGAVDVLQYVAVDDCGNQVNPLIVEGQVHGGVVQGLAQALYEEAIYDADGNLTTSSLTDYLVPAASDVPPITTASTVTPSPTNPMGVKGIGEAGTIGATPAVINAVVDALSPRGVTDVRMPASPNNVWRALQDAKEGGAR
jgi:carbon-monoxide dehydrogenase large subunit